MSDQIPAEIGRFRKRPVVIEAMRWTGENLGALEAFCPGVVDDASSPLMIEPDLPNHLYIRTLEGQMTADPGDWVIRGVKGEFYPCKPDIFSATYEDATLPHLAPPAMDSEAVRTAVGRVLVDAANFPIKVAPHMLGQDMTPLIDKVTESVAAALPYLTRSVRVAPSVEEVAEVLRPYAGKFGARLSARGVLALFASQPTAEQVLSDLFDDLIFRIARGETKGDDRD